MKPATAPIARSRSQRSGRRSSSQSPHGADGEQLNGTGPRLSARCERADVAQGVKAPLRAVLRSDTAAHSYDLKAAQAVVATEERERLRLSRELHDQMRQHVVVLHVRGGRIAPLSTEAYGRTIGEFDSLPPLTGPINVKTKTSGGNA